MLEWRRPRKPSGLTSRGYVGTTASKYGMRLSTKLGLRLLQYLGRVESVYYPPVIRASGLASFRTDASPEVAEVGKASPAKALASSDNLSDMAQ